uniref:SHOCT domain-containing protein n=1 Tax=uncultured Weissella sp. TaxID=253243 RepID=UPI0027DCB155
YSSTKLNLRAYEDVSDAASNRAAQQKISGGVEKNGLGDGGASMLFGMNYAQGLGSSAEQNISNDQPHKEISFDEQVKMLNQLKSLLDSGILTQDEFDSKKKDILGL